MSLAPPCWAAEARCLQRGDKNPLSVVTHISIFLLFLLVARVVFFQHSVTIPVSFTGGGVFIVRSYKLGA